MAVSLKLAPRRVVSLKLAADARSLAEVGPLLLLGLPYRDPHTAATGLWALRHQRGCDFEVSVLVVEGTTQWRKALEAVAITQYRLEHGCSPTLNFGRMRTGYRMSSANNAELVAGGRRYRGGPTTEPTASTSQPATPAERSWPIHQQ